MLRSLRANAASVVVAVATALVIVTVAVAPFLTPWWIAFEQDRAEAAAWTGFSATDLRSATDAIVHDLVVGPPAFDVAVRGAPVLDERERGHMRDVRSVFVGFWALGAVSALVVVAGWVMSRGSPTAARRWLVAVRRGALGLAGAVVVLGVVALVAFDSLFATFHELLFPAGSWTFDPASERLVQLFPYTFWLETSLAVGGLIVVLSLIVAVIAGRRGHGAAGTVGALRSPAPESAR